MIEKMNRQGINILLVDDHAVVREIVKRRLAEIPEVAVIEAANGDDALKMALSEDFDMLLLDITLPDRNGLEILSIIKSRKPALPVLMCSLYPEVPYALQTLKTGAAGYLYKEDVLNHVVDAVRRVSEGGVYISLHLSQYVTSLLTIDPVRALHEMFSDEEVQILCWIAQGRSVAQISEEMHLSEAEVDKARVRILELTNIPDDAGLANYATRNGLVA
ncbi:MAG: response regulator transcription factor RqpR [Sulfuricaulis sp.]